MLQIVCDEEAHRKYRALEALRWRLARLFAAGKSVPFLCSRILSIAGVPGIQLPW